MRLTSRTPTCSLRRWGRGSPECVAAQRRFTESLAGYSLACYLLQVRLVVPGVRLMDRGVLPVGERAWLYGRSWAPGGAQCTMLVHAGGLPACYGLHHTHICTHTASLDTPVPSPCPLALPSPNPQIKDRHNGNIMITAAGRLVHIDFGFLLSNNPGGVNFESAPFKLTREYLEVMDSNSDGSSSDLFDYFKVGLTPCLGVVFMKWWMGRLVAASAAARSKQALHPTSIIPLKRR